MATVELLCCACLSKGNSGSVFVSPYPEIKQFFQKCYCSFWKGWEYLEWRWEEGAIFTCYMQYPVCCTMSLLWCYTLKIQLDMCKLWEMWEVSGLQFRQWIFLLNFSMKSQVIIQLHWHGIRCLHTWKWVARIGCDSCRREAVQNVNCRADNGNHILQCTCALCQKIIQNKRILTFLPPVSWSRTEVMQERRHSMSCRVSPL
jgi:hypothetical protein